MNKISLLIAGALFALAPFAHAQSVTPASGGFVEFNNLTVQSVSAANQPAEIVANNNSVIVSAAGVSSSNATSAGPAIACYRFESQNATSGSAFACPSPSQSYKIEVSASTQLSLRDRTTATLSDFTQGDSINVFGYYNPDGSIQAYLVRDLSKPVETQFIQLNNVDLISISGSSPATLVVAQSVGYPCYGFNASGGMKQSIACPMGVASPAQNSAMQNLSVPAAFAPTWMMMRKYVVTLDSQTILLDSNRNPLTVSNLNIGDQLNVYGDTGDNGQTVRADILRDLSLPAAATTLAGRVTQVNTDGSFLIQTTDGQTITVSSPVQVGVSVKVTGLLDRIAGVLSQITSLII